MGSEYQKTGVGESDLPATLPCEAGFPKLLECLLPDGHRKESEASHTGELDGEGGRHGARNNGGKDGIC